MDTQAHVDPRNFVGEAAKHQFMLYLDREGGASPSVDPALEPLRPLAVELTLNPQFFSVDETAATVISPTQGGGTLVEGRGQIIKDITLSGTTGFLPRRVNSLIVETLPVAVTQNAPYSGYAEFHALRNLFRRYWDAKRGTDPVLRNGLRMAYANVKDNEIWVVEPMQFRTERSVPRNKFTYNYSIVLKALARYDDPSSALALPQSNVVTFLATVNQKVQAFTDTFMAYAESIDFNIATPQVTVLSDFANKLNDAINRMASTARGVLNLPASVFDDAVTAVTTLLGAVKSVSDIPADALEALLRIQESAYEIKSRTDLFGQTFGQTWDEREARLSGAGSLFESDMQTPRSYKSLTVDRVNQGETIAQLALRTMGHADQFMAIIVANKLRPPYLVQDAADKREGLLAPGDAVLIPSLDSGDQTSVQLGYDDIASAYSAQGTVTSADSNALYDSNLADPWIDNCWAGYTVDVAGQTRVVVSNTGYALYVNKPWDTVPGAASSYRIYQNRLVDVSEDQRNYYGIDALLGEDNDLVLGASDDLVTVTGIQNVEQAVYSKTRTEVHGLPLHPDYGFVPEPGEKVTPENLVVMRCNAIRSFLTDPRITGVSRVDIRVHGDKYEIDVALTVKDVEVSHVYERKV